MPTERLLELKSQAEELRVEAELGAGHVRESLGPAQQLVWEAPLRERRWRLLALALYQEGRQADALKALTRARRTLREARPGPR